MLEQGRPLVTVAVQLPGTLRKTRSVSFLYSSSGAAPEELLDYIPHTEFRDVSHTVVRDGPVVAQFSAQQVQNFPRHGRTILIEVEYVEYDASGNAVTTGSAGRAVYYSAREDAELAGTIRLRSDSQQMRLEAGSQLGGEAPAAEFGRGADRRDRARRRLPGQRCRPGGGRAPQDDPLRRAGQRHPGHPVR